MSNFRNLVESLKKPVFFIDSDGKIEYINQSFHQFTGYNLSECNHQSLVETLKITSPKNFFSLADRISKGHEKNFENFKIYKKDGSESQIDLFLYTEKYEGETIGYSGYFQIIPQKLEQQTDTDAQEISQLSEIEEKYKTLYNLTFEGIIIHDHGIIIDVNPSFIRQSGYTREELIGKNVIELSVLPEYHDRVMASMQNEVSGPYEVLSRKKDGTIVHNEVESRRINLGNRTVRVTAIRDVSARKEAEKQLKESEERYKLLSNITFEGIFLHNNGIIVDANQSLADMVGYDLDELIGKNIILLVVLPEYHQRVATALKNEETTPYEVLARRKDGSLFFAEVEARMVHYNGEWLRVTAARDITWRKEAEKKLRENEEELDTFFTRSGDGFFMMKLDNPVAWDDTADKENTLDQVLSEMRLIKINNAMVKQYRAKYDEIKTFTLADFFKWNDKYGRNFTRELLDNGTIIFEMAEPRFDGSVMWTEGNYVVLYDESGKVRGCCGVRREITDRKKAEDAIKKHNEELKKANQELDNFVYRVSHDLKAPISSTKGLINIAKLETQQSRIRTCLGLIENSMDKLDSFILDILDYSRNSRIQIEPMRIDFDELIHDVLSHTQYLRQEKNITIEREVSGEVDLYSDRRRLIFIFNNLISNAIRFSDEKKPDSILKIIVKITDKQAILVFSDNGIGIHPEHLDRIFEMFYRATESRVGSGLGLYIVKEAIDKLAGSIEVKSEIDQGTTFKIVVPNLISNEVE